MTDIDEVFCSMPSKHKSALYPDCLKNKFKDLRRPIVIVGRGQVFTNKIRPALVHLGCDDFLIYSPDYQGRGRLASLGSAPADSIAFILSPNAFHLEQARRLIDLGRPFYLEKPIGRDAREVEQLERALSEEHCPRVYLGDYYIFKALPFLALFGLAAPYESWISGRPELFPLELITEVEGRLHEGGEEPCGRLGTRTWLDRAADGGGMLLDLMVHLVNILECAGLSLTELTECRLWRNVGGRLGLFQDLDDGEKAEDMASVSGFLNRSVAVKLSVAKYALEHDRWLKITAVGGRRAVMRFGAANTLELYGPDRLEPDARVSLAIDPYLLTMADALNYLSGSGGEAAKFHRPQIRAVKLIDQMKALYWGARKQEGAQ